MTQEQIEAVREQLQRSIDALAEPLDEMALAALDTLTKANEELRAEVERLRQKYEDCDLAIKARQILLTEARATIASLNEQCDNADAAFAAKDALIDRLTKERDEASLLAASYLSEWQTMRTRLSAMQEAIAEADRARKRFEFTGERSAIRAIEAALKPFATKPEPEIDPLVEAGLVFSYKGKEYKVTDVRDNYLMQYEDEWVPAVEYECLPDIGKTFYRALPEFQAKFRFVRNHTEGRTDG